MTPTALLALIVVLGEWSGLARSIIGAPAYAAGLDIALAALVAWVFVRAVRARSPHLDRLSILIGAYILLSLLEIANPNVPSLGAGIEGFRKSALTMVAFFIVRYSGDSDPFRFVRIVAIGSIPAFLWAARQVVAPLQIEYNIISTSGVASYSFHSSGALRAFAPTAGPFHLGLLAACVLVIALVVSRSADRSRWWMALGCLAAAVLGATLTRGNVIAAMFAVAVVVLGWPSLRASVRSLAPAALLVAFIAVGSVSAVAVSTIEKAGGSVPPDQVVTDVGGQFDDGNLLSRLGFWKDFAKDIGAKPIFGYGTSSAADGFGHYYANTTSKNFNPHSLYLKPALEFGLVGLAMFLAILGAALVVGRRVLRTDRTIGLIFLGMLTAVTVSGVTGPMLDAYPVNLLFWAMFGWVALIKARRSAEDPPPAAAEPGLA